MCPIGLLFLFLSRNFIMYVETSITSYVCFCSTLTATEQVLDSYIGHSSLLIRRDDQYTYDTNACSSSECHTYFEKKSMRHFSWSNSKDQWHWHVLPTVWKCKVTTSFNSDESDIWDQWRGALEGRKWLLGPVQRSLTGQKVIFETSGEEP